MSNKNPPFLCPTCKKIMSRADWRCDECYALLSLSSATQPQHSHFTRLLLLAISALVLSVMAGVIHFLIQIASAKILGFQFLIYPGIATGALTGFLLSYVKRAQKLDDDTQVFIVAFCAGLIVFLMGAVAITHEGTLFYASAGHPHYHGEMELSMPTYLLLLLGEGICSVVATVKFTMSETF